MRLLEKLKKQINENKQVVENILSLSVLNVINYVFPIVIIPYLIYTLGAEKYGIYAFVFSIYQYLLLIVNYGFMFSATKLVSIHRNELEKVSKIFWSVLAVRLLLSFSCSVLVLLSVAFIDIIQNEKSIYLYGIGLLFGTALTPLFLFQGLEKMKYVTIINAIPKLLLTILIFIFINSEEDYSFVILFQAIGFLAAGILSLILAIKTFNIKFVLPSSQDLLYQFRDGWHIFASTISMSFYRESNVLILGFLTNYTVVGFYASAEKVIKAVQSLSNPVTQALYPYFSYRLNKENADKSLQNVLNFGKYFALFLSLITLSIVLLSPSIIEMTFSGEYEEMIRNIQLLSPAVFFGGLNYFLGIIILLNLGYKEDFLKSVLICGIFSVATSFVLSSYYGGAGASITMSLTEGLLFALLSIKVYKRVGSKSIYKNVPA